IYRPHQPPAPGACAGGSTGGGSVLGRVQPRQAQVVATQLREPQGGAGGDQVRGRGVSGKHVGTEGRRYSEVRSTSVCDGKRLGGEVRLSSRVLRSPLPVANRRDIDDGDQAVIIGPVGRYRMMAKKVLVAGPLQMVKALARRLRGRHISPSEQDIAYIHASNKFDSDWYLSRYQDVAAAGLDPITHYVLYGAAEGRDPSGDFSTNFYLQNNPDVKASGINPFRHYLEYGIQEGRRPKPNGHEASASPGKASIYDEDISTIRASGLFDREYYLSRYPDVAKAGMDPVEHYVIHGTNEGRSPRPDFDTWFYLRENPDVIIDKLNPFRHYIEKGRGEGRETLPEERKEITGGPLVSVVVPVYAVEQYLADCLRSIVSQSYRNLEVIVVDDGSPDGSYEIADAFARTDSRVRIIRRANGGLGAARNTGVAEARGRYLTFVDSDDIVPRDAIARMVGSLQQSGSDFVVGAVRR